MNKNTESNSEPSKLTNDVSSYKKLIRTKNPSIFHFNKQSIFIYEATHSGIYYSELNDKNHMKLTNDEIAKLKDFSAEEVFEEKDNLKVRPFFKDFMNLVKETKPILDRRDIIIKNLIMSIPKNYNISIRKITAKFNEIAEKEKLKKINKSTMQKIFRKKLLMNFRKRTIKNEKLLSSNFIRFSFFFIKVFFRSLNLGLKPIFIDESGFFLKNNNFRTWVFNNENIYYGKNASHKINLILAVSNEKVIYYQLNKENTNSLIFQKFMDELEKKLDNSNEKEDHFLVMDNFSGHLTPEMFKFYREKKFKILFSVPYASQYNMVENVFRFIKNTTYKRLYNSINVLSKEIEELLKGITISSTLGRLFKETIKEYLEFVDNYKSYNLN